MKKKKFTVLVTGARGMLGSDIMAGPCAAEGGTELVGADAEDFDITDAAASAAFIDKVRPDALIHCAAYTNVDAAEGDVDTAFRVNAMAARDLAAMCGARGIRFALISTDYVFDGEKKSPYGEYDQPAPLNVYGMSKYYAERYALQLCPRGYIVRTSWLFGKNGHNFVKAILKKARTEGALSVVDDQTGSPTYTRDLARFLMELVRTEKYGIYHATNEGYCTWHGFAREILDLCGLSGVKLFAVTSDEFKRPAARPKNSMLSKTALYCSGFDKFRPWQEALKEYLAETNS